MTLDGLPAWVRIPALLAGLAAGALLLGFLFERIVLSTLRRLAKATRNEMDDLVVKAVHPALGLLVVLLAFQAGLWWAGRNLPPAFLGAWRHLALAFGILVVAIMGARLLGGLLRHFARRHARWRPVTRLGTRIGNVAVYAIALLVILGSYGISITPLITSLGIAGLAVALALQDTLSNFFAGVWIQSGQSLQPGHYVRLEGEKLEGYIDDIGWRTTKIRQLGNYVTVVPNAKLAQAVVTDYHLPDPRMSVLLNVAVGYECDPRHVERLLAEEAQGAVGQVEGLLADPPPSVRFSPGFGDYSLQFTLSVHVREYVDQYLVQHELRLRIHERFRREGIRIPYPLRETYAVPPTRPDVARFSQPPGAEPSP
ncbi:MAG TPA: mechanosensitive ion channel family protein [Candidatus Thermoplasmatota archaeon]|nr:mechanosensitive ion channel family protein [Candidatus Thermoplasmatota archaeon]